MVWIWSLMVALIMLAIGLTLKIAELTHSNKLVNDELSGLRKKLDFLNDDHDKQIADLKEFHATEIAKLTELHGNKITEYQKNLAEVQSRLQHGRRVISPGIDPWKAFT